MRSTFNILFYVNKSKMKNGKGPVMGRVTINGTQSQFSCKKTVSLDMWDVKSNCAKGRSKEATIWQRCMWLKGVVLRAHYNGKIPRNPFAQFHISPNCKEREFLTEDELKAVVIHQFDDANLAFVRDIFVFVCFTALSFIDVKELTTDNIVNNNGDKWIISVCKVLGLMFRIWHTS